MISRIDLRGRTPGELTRTAMTGVLPRASLDVEAAVRLVRPICEDIQHRGAAAVREYTRRFDGVDLPSTRVPQDALNAALAALDPAVRAALEEAIRRTRRVHSAQMPAETATPVTGGLTVSGRFVPVSRAGVYVPGGLVAYPSSVVMNVVPAQVAGVDEVAVASPPQKDGRPHPVVLAACALLGVTEVHAAGGAQALAMFAYGTEDCGPADVITGPGNVYVAAAKRVLRGAVGTDGENGPTEVAIIADDTADPAYVAADLIAQAEHDELAGCLLISTDEGLAGRVDAELARQVPLTRHRERVETALAGQGACVLVDDLDAALAVSDAWAPEHLEIQARDAAKLAARVRNAGAVFAGPYAPVSLGDYLAGSNHVLPTGGTARHTSGLTVFPFLRLVNVIECDRETLAGTAPLIDALGGAEDLAAHVAAVRVRQGGPGGMASPRERHGVMEAPQFVLRKDLEDLEAYGAPQIDVPVRLNTNENPYPPSSALVRAVADAVAGVAGSLNRYPDRDAVELRKDLADYLGHGLTGAQVWAANGSNEVIQQLLQAFGGPGRRAMGFEPSYSMHPLISRVTCTSWVAVNRDPDFGVSAARAAQAVTEVAPSLVFLTSPNNPTGTAMPLDVVAAVCEAAPGIVVVDEAYFEFARSGTPSALSLLPRYPGLVVTRTMSKAFAMAGARVGYMAATPELIAKLLVVRLPYHLSAVTQAVARAALAHSAEPLATVELLRSSRDSLVGWLRGRGLSVADSDANFVLFGEFADRSAVWRGLLDRGVLVREVGPPRWLRVTVGTPDEMTAFRGALDEVLAL